MKYLLIIGSMLLMLTGCSRYHCWIRDAFSQADLMDETPIKRAQHYIRSCSLYDRFATVALIDALWISREVQSAYTDLSAQRWLLSDIQKNTLFEAEIEQFQNEIAFCVLLAPDEKNNILSLMDKRARWTLLLRVDDREYVPIQIRRVDLNPEYACFFGKRFSIFKGAYLVIFNAYDACNNVIITNSSHKIDLLFRSVRYFTQLTWCLKNKECHECIDSYCDRPSRL